MVKLLIAGAEVEISGQSVTSKVAWVQAAIRALIGRLTEESPSMLYPEEGVVDRIMEEFTPVEILSIDFLPFVSGTIY